MTTYSPEPAIAPPSEADAIAPNYIEMLETVISSLEQEGTAMVSHAQEGYLWKFGYGSAEVFVQLTGLTDDDTLTVWSEVMPSPATLPTAMAVKLLELNWSTTLEARFALLNQDIVVVTSRTLAGLSPSEVSRCITIVATLADEYKATLSV